MRATVAEGQRWLASVCLEAVVSECIMCAKRDAEPRNGGLCGVCAPPLRLTKWSRLLARPVWRARGEGDNDGETQAEDGRRPGRLRPALRAYRADEDLPLRMPAVS